MFFIPKVLMNTLTFPGVICHEIAHKFFCDITNIPVYEVCYFDLKNSEGYIFHGEPQDLKSAVLISIGPLLINTALCFLIGSVAIVPFETLTSSSKPSLIFLIWVSISLGMHAFPSNKDIQNLKFFIKKKESNKYLLFTIIVLYHCFKIINFLRFFGLDFIYAVVISSTGCSLLINFLLEIF